MLHWYFPVPFNLSTKVDRFLNPIHCYKLYWVNARTYIHSLTLSWQVCQVWEPVLWLLDAPRETFVTRGSFLPIIISEFGCFLSCCLCIRWGCHIFVIIVYSRCYVCCRIWPGREFLLGFGRSRRWCCSILDIKILWWCGFLEVWQGRWNGFLILME